MKLKDVVWASLLAAMAVVLKIVTGSLSHLITIRVPLYAIPIIISALFLGFKYSVIVAILTDVVGILLTPGVTFLPLYTIAATMWGFLPGLLINKRQGFIKILIIVLITHLFVTTINSIAHAYYGPANFKAFYVAFVSRVWAIIPNSIVIAGASFTLIKPIELRLDQNSS